jgi:hypothetical protein
MSVITPSSIPAITAAPVGERTVTWIAWKNEYGEENLTKDLQIKQV